MADIRDDMWFFFHMPKAAGGTLFRSIRADDRVYWPADFYTRPDDIPSPTAGKMVWLASHHIFGLHEVHKAKPRYLSVLREPVTRLISEFFYGLAQDADPSSGVDAECGLDSFLRYVDRQPHLNYYSYAFSKFCFEKEVEETGSPSGGNDCRLGILEQRANRRGFLAYNCDFSKVSENDAYSAAMDNINRYFGYIGIYERLGDIVAYFQTLGIKIDLGVRLHSTPKLPLYSDLPVATRKQLIKKTMADAELYYRVSLAKTAAADDSDLIELGLEHYELLNKAQPQL